MTVLGASSSLLVKRHSGELSFCRRSGLRHEVDIISHSIIHLASLDLLYRVTLWDQVYLLILNILNVPEARIQMTEKRSKASPRSSTPMSPMCVFDLILQLKLLQCELSSSRVPCIPFESLLPSRMAIKS